MKNLPTNLLMLKSIHRTVRFANSNFLKSKSETDKLGISHDKFQLYHQGLKVEFSTHVALQSWEIRIMSGDFINWR
jgi:hypothetical protein